MSQNDPAYVMHRHPISKNRLRVRTAPGTCLYRRVESELAGLLPAKLPRSDTPAGTAPTRRQAP